MKKIVLTVLFFGLVLTSCTDNDKQLEEADIIEKSRKDFANTQIDKHEIEEPDDRPK